MPETTKADNVLSITVLAAPSVLTFIKQETLRYDDQGLETGGILVGIWLDQDTCYLVGATGSGPMAEHAQYSFAVDTDYANNELNRIRQSFPGSDYVGEWHKHPAVLERPSQGDLMTARQLLADPDYPIRLLNPIMTVKNHQALFHLFYLDRDLPDFVRLQEHGQIEAETDDEPWDDGSSIYHANIVLVPKNKQPQLTQQTAPTVAPARPAAVAPKQAPKAGPTNQPKAAPATPPVNFPMPPGPAFKPAQPPQPVPSSLLEVPSPFTGEAGDLDSDTVRKYSKLFDTMPPARLSSTYNDTGPGSRPREPYFEPVPPASLNPDYNWNNYQPPSQPPGAANQGYPPDDDDDTIAMGQSGADKTFAMRQPSGQPPQAHMPPQPRPTRARTGKISPTLVLIVAGLILLLIILLLVFFLTR